MALVAFLLLCVKVPKVGFAVDLKQARVPGMPYGSGSVNPAQGPVRLSSNRLLYEQQSWDQLRGDL